MEQPNKPPRDRPKISGDDLAKWRRHQSRRSEESRSSTPPLQQGALAQRDDLHDDIAIALERAAQSPIYQSLMSKGSGAADAEPSTPLQESGAPAPEPPPPDVSARLDEPGHVHQPLAQALPPAALSDLEEMGRVGRAGYRLLGGPPTVEASSASADLGPSELGVSHRPLLGESDIRAAGTGKSASFNSGNSGSAVEIKPQARRLRTIHMGAPTRPSAISDIGGPSQPLPIHVSDRSEAISSLYPADTLPHAPTPDIPSQRSSDFGDAPEGSGTQAPKFTLVVEAPPDTPPPGSPETIQRYLREDDPWQRRLSEGTGNTPSPDALADLRAAALVDPTSGESIESSDIEGPSHVSDKLRPRRITQGLKSSTSLQSFIDLMEPGASRVGREGQGNQPSGSRADSPDRKGKAVGHPRGGVR